MILFNKTETPTDWQEFRPISIIPAVQAILEKIAAPVVKEITRGSITEIQFGFKEFSNCNLAKLRVAYYARTRNYNRILMIDLKKAYDSVNLVTLQNIIINRFGNEKALILINLLEAYRNLQISLYNNEINPEVGLPQGAPFSCVFFNIYIDQLLRDLDKHSHNTKTQAFADDIETQSNNLDDLSNILGFCSKEFEKLGMPINYNKCVLIS